MLHLLLLWAIGYLVVFGSGVLIFWVWMLGWRDLFSSIRKIFRR